VAKEALELTELTDWRLLFGELDGGLDAILVCPITIGIVKRNASRGRTAVYRELLLVPDEARGSKM
jgi:hypothetical protein